MKGLGFWLWLIVMVLVIECRGHNGWWYLLVVTFAVLRSADECGDWEWPKTEPKKKAEGVEG